nr:MAG TPA: hypothetical protein [Caudoviricetes sp.]
MFFLYNIHFLQSSSAGNRRRGFFCRSFQWKQ